MESFHQRCLLFSLGGRQFKVTPNDLIVVNQIQADIGNEIYLEKVTTTHTVEHR